MATFSENLEVINNRQNVKGEELRTAIHDALAQVNTISSNANSTASSLNNRIETVVQQKVNAANQTALAPVNNRLSALETRASSHESTMSALSRADTTLQNNINSLALELRNADTGITTVLGARITDVETAISEHEDHLDQLDAARLDLVTSDENLAAALETVNDTLTSHEGLISDVDGRVDVVSGDLSALNGDYTSFKSSFSANLNDTVSGLTDSVTSLGLRVDALEDTSTSLNSYISAAVNDASEALDSASSAYDIASNLQSALDTLSGQLALKVDAAEVDEGFLWLTADGERVAGPYGPFNGTGGGGGGGSTNNAVMTARNISGWAVKRLSRGSECHFLFTWSSLEDGYDTGSGTVRITVNGATRDLLNIQQGNVDLDIVPYLGVGTNTFSLTVEDAYGNTVPLRFTVILVDISISSNFENNQAYGSTIEFEYVPYGSDLTKTVHFLVDGVEVGTRDVKTSGHTQRYIIPAQNHGVHSLEVYFTTTFEGQEIESNHLYYELICYKPGNLSPIISIDYNRTSEDQYMTINIPYLVWDPVSDTANVELLVNGVVVSQLTAGRERQIWSYRCDTAGENILTVRAGSTENTKVINVRHISLDVAALEGDTLMLHLSSYGRSNLESTRDVWEFGEGSNKISAELSGFNFVSNGWMLDDDGITVLRFGGNASCYIPFFPFATDAKETGLTVEIEFATRDVLDFDAVVVSCMQGNVQGELDNRRGFQLTANEATFRSSQKTVSMHYKDEDHHRVSFTVARDGDRGNLILCYVNGIMSGADSYISGDDFTQPSPVGITIGSTDCGIDIYGIRIYSTCLSPKQVLANFIADTQNGSLLLERYQRNHIYDEYENILPDLLPKNLPYMIIEGPNLPAEKNDNFPVDIQFVNPTNHQYDFTATGCSIKVQGTSSLEYKVKNFKIKFQNGLDTPAGHVDKYKMNEHAIPVKTFCLKADVASSEGANNVELMRLYDDLSPYRTPPQMENANVRQGIDGFPIVVFWNRPGVGMSFYGKYNFNNDKSTEEVFGFQEGDQSWETKNNRSYRALFKSADFESGTWTTDYGGRYPEDNPDYTDLQAFISNFVNPSSITKQTFESTSMVQSALFYYLFTELFLMIDSRAKNSFPTRFSEDGKWCWIPYDGDTAIGINNEGALVFGYSLEDTDEVGGSMVFNGQDHNYWCALRDLYSREIGQLYATLRASRNLSYSAVQERFHEHQSKWPEAIMNEDAERKYLEPWINDNASKYLPMVQGTKESQRNWWLYNRFRYMDSKYMCGDDAEDIITFRSYGSGSIMVTPHIDMYCNATFGTFNTFQSGRRINRGETIEIPYPTEFADGVDTEVHIHSASLLSDVGDLSPLKLGTADFSKAIRLQRIKVGDGNPNYENTRLEYISLGNSPMLKSVDCRNCTGLQDPVDLSMCTNLEEVLFDGSKTRGVALPNGGMMRILRLPNTISQLSIQNQPNISTFFIEPGAQISTLLLDGVSDSIDALGLMSNMVEGSRVRYTGFTRTATMDQVTSYSRMWDRFKGVDPNGRNVESAYISGTFIVTNATGSGMKLLKESYPFVTVRWTNLSCTVEYRSEDGSTLYSTRTVYNGGDETGYTGTPTKASTEYFTYTFVGWSASIGGPLWPDARRNVTEDRTLYAYFQAIPRYYTVDFYVGNVLKATVANIPYLGTAIYPLATPTDPNGTGKEFSRWDPSNIGITSNRVCRALFRPALYETIFDSWAEIQESIDNDTYKTKYRIGDTKKVYLGEMEDLGLATIAGFDVDNLESGGKAAISWIFKHVPNYSIKMNQSGATTEYRTEYSGPGWTYDSNEYYWKSMNSGYHSTTVTGVWTYTPKETGRLLLSYRVSSESPDKLSISINGSSVVSNLGGTSESVINWTLYTRNVTAGVPLTIRATFSKDSSVNTGRDRADIRIESDVEFDLVDDIQPFTYRIADGYTIGTGAIGGWEHCQARAYCQELFNGLSDDLKSVIKPVTKTQTALNKNGSSYTQNTVDRLWIPSSVELGASGTASIYPIFTTDNITRCKSTIYDEIYQTYWCRDIYKNYSNDTSYWYYINASGSRNSQYCTSTYHYALGFCT